VNMKIIVAKNDLEEALHVAGIGRGKVEGDLSAHYVFRIRDGGVEILSQNKNRICMRVPLNGCTSEGDDGSAMTLEGWRLEKWLKGVRNTNQALELSSDGNGKGELKAERTTITVQGLDPTLFPFFDEQLEEAQKTTTMTASKLSSAFSYAQHFIFSEETTKPEISQVEVMNSHLWATDKKSVTLISSENFGPSAFRVHGKDVPLVAQFLSHGEDNDVEIKEHNRAVFFKRADGFVMCVTRPIAEFPSLNVKPDGDDDASWEVDCGELSSGIKCLEATAPRDNNVFCFSFSKDRDKVVMSVDSAAGSRDEYDLECISKENIDAIPDEGFFLNYSYLEKIMAHFPSMETLKLGINKRGKGGFVCFRNGSGEDLNYATVMVWKI